MGSFVAATDSAGRRLIVDLLYGLQRAATLGRSATAAIIRRLIGVGIVAARIWEEFCWFVVGNGRKLKPEQE